MLRKLRLGGPGNALNNGRNGLTPAEPEQQIYGLLRMARTSPFKFLQEVRAEAQKVTWPTRRETAVTTVMVFIMSAIASVFFLIADQIIRFLVTLVLGIGG